jgi:hypothetical protein
VQHDQLKTIDVNLSDGIALSMPRHWLGNTIGMHENSPAAAKVSGAKVSTDSKDPTNEACKDKDQSSAVRDTVTSYLEITRLIFLQIYRASDGVWNTTNDSCD